MQRGPADSPPVIASPQAAAVRDVLSLIAAGIVTVTAAAGGAFDPTVAVWAGVCAALVAGVMVASRSFVPDGFEWALVACLAWAGIVAFIDRLSPLASKEAIAGWLIALIIMMAARRAGQRSRRVSLGLLAGTGVVIVIWQVLDAVSTRQLRSAGPFIDPNLVAALLVPLIPLVMVMISKKTVAAALLIVLSVGVVLTGSRAGVVALAVALLIAARRGWQRRAVAVAVAAGAAVVWWRFAAHPDAFAWYRTSIWGALVRLLGAHPVMGIGPGGFPDATGVVRLAHRTGCALHARRIGGAESMLVGWIVRTGTVGVAIGLAAIVALGQRLASRRWWGGRGFAASLGAIGIMALFHDFFDVAIVLWWWGLLLGLGLSSPDDMPSGAAPGTRGRSGASRVIPGVVVAGLVLWGMTQPALARLVARRGEDATTVRRAVRLEPWLDTAALARVHALLTKGRWTWADAAEARRWSDVAVHVHRGSSDAWVLVGDVNARIVSDLGIWPAAVERAREGYRMACRLEPELPWAWVAWARLERTLGHIEAARRLDQRAVLAEPNCVRAWLLLGRIDLDLGRIGRARQDLEAARRARRCGQGRLLEAYDRDLMAAPAWQWSALEEALR